MGGNQTATRRPVKQCTECSLIALAFQLHSVACFILATSLDCCTSVNTPLSCLVQFLHFITPEQSNVCNK